MRVCGVKPIELAFGFSGYKGKQKEIIEAAISGEPVTTRRVVEAGLTRYLGADVFVLAPTGMGKVGFRQVLADFPYLELTESLLSSPSHCRRRESFYTIFCGVE